MRDTSSYLFAPSSNFCQNLAAEMLSEGRIFKLRRTLCTFAFLFFLASFVTNGCAQTITTLTVQEALWPNVQAKNAVGETTAGAASGIARTNEPLTIGLPLSDSQAITSPQTQLAITGASIQQFRCIGNWPSGHCKWVLIDTQIPSLPANATTTLTVTTGSGNSGGSNLATDNGGTITVATGSSTFTIKKANFNVFDSVVTQGGVTLVSSGTSSGFALQGPPADGSTTTCANPLSGCTTLYTSANDPNSTCSIEENGPARASIKCTGGLVNGSEAYLTYTARLHFYKGLNRAKIEVALQNDNVSTGAGNFASATKGYRSFDVRVGLSLGSGKAATFAKDGGTQNYSYSGSENAYSLQGFTTRFEGTDWTNSAILNPYIYRTSSYPYTYSLSGFQIDGNNTKLYSASATASQAGWADINDSNGHGMTMGGYMFAEYFPHMLAYFGGGTDARIGLWMDQSLWLSPVSNTVPYYLAWPQVQMDTVYLNFHDATVTNPGNEILKQQEFLLARAPIAYYNSTGVFPVTLEDPTELDSFVATAGNTAKVSLPAGNIGPPTDFAPTTFRNYGWSGGSGSNQTDFPWDYLLQYLSRGWTGRLHWGINKEKMTMETAFARANGFNWYSHSPQSDLGASCWPIVPSANSANSLLGGGTNIWIDELHGHVYGIIDYYHLFGDEFYRDFVRQAMYDHFTNPGNPGVSCGIHLPYPNSGGLGVQRAYGTSIINNSRLHNFAVEQGDTTPAANAQTTIEHLITIFSQDVVISGTGKSSQTCYDITHTNSYSCDGLSKTRGYFFPESFSNAFVTASPFTYSACINSTTYPWYPQGARLAQPYQIGIVNNGLFETLNELGPSWGHYNEVRDYMLGMSQWALLEGATDNGNENQSGFRYSIPGDHVCSGSGTTTPVCHCEPFFAAEQTVWYNLTAYLSLTGDTSHLNLLTRAIQALQYHNGVASDPGRGWDENGGYGLGEAINTYLHPPSKKLQTVGLTSFSESPAGTYHLSWSALSGTTAQSLKYDVNGKTVVDWLNFNPDSGNESDGIGGTWGVDPTSHSPWFSATYTTTQPAATATSITVVLPQTGLPQSAFMLKALATSAATDTTPPTIAVTSPANGTVLPTTGTVTLTASASDNVAVTAVQFVIDGTNFGPSISSAPYSTGWDLSKVATGSHTITAVAQDAAGNLGFATAVSVTVSSSADTTPPTVSITAPTAGATASGVILVTASASDNKGVSYVQFFVDGNALGQQVLTSPYSTQWNTASVANGTHSLTALASDAAGNTTTSASVTVTVSNTSSGTVSGPGWRKICDNIAGNCPVGPLWPGARGYMNALPYDSSRHEFLYLGSVAGNADIYSTAIWGYSPTRGSTPGHMTLRIDNGLHSTTGDHNVCAYYTGANPIAGAASANPLSGHPLGNATFDTLRNKMYASGWLCNNYFGGETASYNSATATMDPSFLGNEYNSCTGPAAPAACLEGRSFQNWVYMPKGPSGNSLDKVMVGLSDANSSLRVAEYNPSTQTYTNVSSALKGSNGAACTATNCPPAVLTSYGAAYNSTDGYIYIYGGCNGSLPGNGAPNPCTGANQNDLWKYDGELHQFTKVAPADGVKPPATNASSPFFVYDSQRNRLLLYEDTNALWAYSPATNLWTLTTTSGGPQITSYMQGDPFGQVSGYDPSTDTMVLIWIDSGGQANSPTIWELGLSTTATPDTTPPTVKLTAPANNASITGGVTLSATASDNVGVAGVQFTVDGVNVGPQVTTPPFNYVWNSATAANGQHTVTAIAEDLSGNYNQSSVTVTTTNVAIDTTPPTVAITSPTANQTVSGQVAINVTASDNIGVASVVVKVDGAQVGSTLTSAPYSATWDTSNAGSGPHIITATATDTSGNSATATVTVQIASRVITNPSGFTIDSNTQFSVETDDLTSILSCPTCYFSTATDLILGQTVEVRFRAGTTNTLDSIVLQQGTVSGTVTSSLGLNFVMQASDAILGQQSVTVDVGTVTQYIGAAQGATLAVGQKVAVRGLLLKTGQSNGPTLVAKQIELIQ